MSTKSKHRKNHKQKVAARNTRLAHEKRRTEKMQREFIMNLIKQEQEKGLFENTVPLLNDGPVIDGPLIDGPLIDGPVIDGPMFNQPVIDGPMFSMSVNDETIVDNTETVEVIEETKTEE